MTTPFDGRILWWHWQGSVVEEETIADLAETVKTGTPNATGIALKTSNGKDWQGDSGDTKAAMAITGPDKIAAWVDELAAHGLETHLWCVAHGHDVEAEAEKIVTACLVPGVKAMILDVEAGERYFGSHPPEVARALIKQIHAELPSDFHLGLCLFAREDEPGRIHIDEWLPYVQSLHPMVYHWDFSDGKGEPEPYIDEASANLTVYGLPLVPILGTYRDTSTNTDIPAEHLYRGAMYALGQGAVGISFFRLGAAGPGAFEAIRRICPG